MARWRALRACRCGVRVVSLGEVRDLLVGSIWMGRRVKVGSIVGVVGLVGGRCRGGRVFVSRVRRW